ncbi:MAG: hypothetical protein EB156_02200 [Euryarchaeota archaeon]|nr:hypothetical protein [Euryarchaeota archaeon]NDF36588.1 hypothetical protein [Euryarchaeota archaeon]
MRVVRVLSILPGAVGVACMLIGGMSTLGFSLDSERIEIPIVPCSDASEEGCLVGMTGSDLDVPGGFILLDVKMGIEWSEPSKSWIGVVDSAYAEDCPPNSDGLTPCNEQLVVIQPVIALAPFLELVLMIVGLVLLICAIEMIYPVEVLWRRFQKI